MPKNIDAKHEKPCILIFDDLLLDISNSNMILELFTTISHHSDKSICLITQSLFLQSKNFRIISLNANYYIIFAHPRERGQIAYLGRQIFPHNSNFLPKAYFKATENRAFSFLFLDLHQTTPDNLRVWSDILNTKPIIYTWVNRNEICGFYSNPAGS